MAATVRGHKEITALLIGKGAAVNAQNSDGRTALMFAYNGRNQATALLDKYSDSIKEGDQESGDNNTKIIQEALATHTDIVTALLAAGADADLKDNEGHAATDFDYKPEPKADAAAAIGDGATAAPGDAAAAGAAATAVGGAGAAPGKGEL